MRKNDAGKREVDNLTPKSESDAVDHPVDA